MENADANARLVADYLRDHAIVAKVHYLAHLDENSADGRLFRRRARLERRFLQVQIHRIELASLSQTFPVLDVQHASMEIHCS